MKKLSEKKKRKKARKEVYATTKQLLQEYASRFNACVIVNSKGEPLSLNVSKLASIYTQKMANFISSTLKKEYGLKQVC